MFRKPKAKNHNKKAQNNRRKRQEDDENDETSDDTRGLLSEARKRLKQSSSAPQVDSDNKNTSMHSFEASNGPQISGSDLATSSSQQLPTSNDTFKEAKEAPNDGIFRDKSRNAFYAGPVRAATNIRVTARFDYEPNVCKDYKETGFCGFGDTCIYLHDRGDTLKGWQLEENWEKQKRLAKEKQQEEMDQFVCQIIGKQQDDSNGTTVLTTDDGIPFACHICREYFKDPVVTTCQHYFCQKCIMNHVRTVGESCPICDKDTSSVFNQPTKLLAKRRAVLGIEKAREDNSWELYLEAFANRNKGGT